MLLCSKLFLLSPAPMHTNTRGGDQKHAGYSVLCPKNIHDRKIANTLPSDKCSIASWELPPERLYEFDLILEYLKFTKSFLLQCLQNYILPRSFTLDHVSA